MLKREQQILILKQSLYDTKQSKDKLNDCYQMLKQNATILDTKYKETLLRVNFFEKNLKIKIKKLIFSIV